MIPISLRITGFLSYKDTAELDFSSFNLACISGSNGAGKSSILDAITWALFGQARKRDESLINSHPDVKLAEVVFTFQYEDQVYRVIRSIQKGKGTSLEFQIQAESEDEDEKIWRAISEHSIRETQNRIQETLRLDYETFVNAAFFLQGKADQFAQQQPGKRKEILGSILGLEQWEIYKEKAGERRRKVERELDAIDGQMREISQELSEETQRKEALSKFEEQMVHLSSSRKKLETNLENMKNLITSIAHQRKLVDTLRDNLNKARITREEVVNRRDSRSDELIAKRSLLERADEIKNTYETWLDLQKKIADMNDLESNYKKLESKTLPLISRIETQKAKLDIELQSLKSKESEIFTMNQTLPDLNAEIQSARRSLLQLEKRIAEKDQWDQEIRSSRELQGALKSESENLTTISLEKKERISKLSETEGANCPLCGQPLTKADRIRLIDELQEEVSANRITYQNNQMKMKDVISRVEELEIHLSETRSLENDRLSISSKLAKLEEKLELINKSNQEWESQKSVYQDIQEKM
ncbi:MAG: AAA family ATPase, partial [Anaerolineales bacterium]